MGKFRAILIMLLLVMLLPQMANALSYTKISNIAKEITVVIDGCSSGSGVIYQRKGNTYYVLTTKHVVDNGSLMCLVITPDGEIQNIDSDKITIPVSDVDLAVVKFESKKRYKLARFGNSGQVNIGQTIYVAGAPEPSEAIPVRTMLVTSGNIVGIQPPSHDYSLIYNNATRRGMSGGPVLDEHGRVIGIHGQGDKQDGSKTGLNLAIPIETFLSGELSENKGWFRWSGGWGVFGSLLGGLILVIGLIARGRIEAHRSHTSRTISPEEIAEFTVEIDRAIEQDPHNSDAYFNRAIIRSDLGDTSGAIKDYTRAIELAPDFAYAYNNRAICRYSLGDIEGAIEDYTRAIELNPHFADAYNNRGTACYDLRYKQWAIEDYTKAIDLNPHFIDAYYNRGIVRSDLGDKFGAIEDYTKAIDFNPHFIDAYYNRSIAWKEVGDKQGALKDKEKAAELDRQQTFQANAKIM